MLINNTNYYATKTEEKKMSRHHQLIHEDMILEVKREPDMIPINV